MCLNRTYSSQGTKVIILNIDIMEIYCTKTYTAPDLFACDVALSETIMASGDETFTASNGFEEATESDYQW